MSEYGRCKCGSVRFQHSSELSNDYVICNQCHMVWGIEDRKLKRLKNEFSDEELDAIIAGVYSVKFACKPEEHKQSLIDYMLEEVEYQ